MDVNKILSATDHTLLAQDATFDDIKLICDDAIKYKTVSVCIPASFVKRASEYVHKRVKICTVIGFPNGYSTTASKCFEAKDAVLNGADEIDMVINIGALKEKRYSDILDEINQIKASCSGRLLKVIIETCLLNNEEKVKMCEIVSISNADYIKTSTGFSSAGASFDDIKLFKENLCENKKIKAAGGIASLEDAQKFLNLGAERLGTSRIVKEIKKIQGEETYGNTSY